MMLIVIALPLFIIWRVPQLMGFTSLLLTVVYTEFLICQAISAMEFKYPKAAALLCSTPYSRHQYVKSKYVFVLFVFAYCYIVYSLVTMLIPQAAAPDLVSTLGVFLIVMLIYGLYLPLELRFGFEKMKFFFMATLLTVSFGIPMLYNANIQVDLSWISAIPSIVKCVALAIMSITALAISIAVSTKIFEKKEFS